MACFPGLPEYLNRMAWFPQNARSQSLSSDKDPESYEQRIAGHTMQDPQVRQIGLPYALAFNIVVGLWGISTPRDDHGC
jgi:hypothetical protein